MVLRETADPRQTWPCPEHFTAHPARPLTQVTVPASAQVRLCKEPWSLVSECSRWGVEAPLGLQRWEEFMGNVGGERQWAGTGSGPATGA